MLVKGDRNDQSILAYFTRPTRTINHRLIGQIRRGTRYPAVPAATSDALDKFLDAWPVIDPATGLSIDGDELLIKAREAMIAAVRTFNSTGLQFRAELFIVTAIIAWTYLLHAFYKRKRIDYRYKRQGRVVRTTEGAEKFWDLDKCLDAHRCPVPDIVKKNLRFLIKLRHEIEHRSTGKLDVTIGAALQACCINFNDQLRTSFGREYLIERDLPIALQFVAFSPEQRALLKGQSQLPQHIQTMSDNYFDSLSEAERDDPRFMLRVAFVQKVGKASKADVAVEFIGPGEERSDRLNSFLVKDVDRERFSATQVLQKIHQAGFPKFNSHNHTQLWKSLDARSPDKHYGKPGLWKGSWEWFEPWVTRVQQYCQDQGDKFR
jgi:hypothetical protein